jgi:hypothetical protein
MSQVQNYKGLTNRLDKIAGELESKGLTKLAEQLDIISNSLDVLASQQNALLGVPVKVDYTTINPNDNVHVPHGVHFEGEAKSFGRLVRIEGISTGDAEYDNDEDFPEQRGALFVHLSTEHPKGQDVNVATFKGVAIKADGTRYVFDGKGNAVLSGKSQTFQETPAVDPERQRLIDKGIIQP